MVKPRKTAQQSDEAKAKRAEKRAEREVAEQREAAERAARLAAKLEEVRDSAGTLEELLRETRQLQRRRADLADHLSGFYGEVDKLAKGKAMLEVTTLVLEEANQIIRDAKAIVIRDAYLDRVKEFVAAGNNPVYPDVVVALRSVLQALERATGRLERRLEQIQEHRTDVGTLLVSLELLRQTGKSPSLTMVRQAMRDESGGVDASWFTNPEYGSSMAEYRLFDLARLEAISSLDTYFTIEDDE